MWPNAPTTQRQRKPFPGRIAGIETEYGCFVRDESLGQPEAIVEAVKDYAFQNLRLGLIDIHDRSSAFEPAYSGGFLLNGGRLYVDEVGSHEEYATPECRSVFDLVAHERAGRLILQRILNDMGLADSVSFHNNSVDHFGGHTFGCHENYLFAADDAFFRRSLQLLLPFLVTRQIFAGAGRVAGHRLNRRDLKRNVMQLGEYPVDYVWVDNFYGVELDNSVDFQLSQRADHIVRAVSGRVRFNRAIINPKHDSFFDYGEYQRLHLLFGEANMNEYATALKIGTTMLVLDLLEVAAVPDEVMLGDPLQSLKSVSRDPTWKWPVERASGGSIGSVDLQRIYLARARDLFQNRDPDTDWILREWEATLNALEHDPQSLGDRLDWVAKRNMMELYIEDQGTSWRDDALHSLDMAYHDINSETGLFHDLERDGYARKVIPDEKVRKAVTNAPVNTRAWGRARAIRRLMKDGVREYIIDWDGVYASGDRVLEMVNPFANYDLETEQF
jgi:proteasome accessory factor A